MQRRFIRPRKQIISLFSEPKKDILFCALLFLDFQNMYQMRLLSKDYQKTIDQIFDNPVFWSEKAKRELSEDQLVSATDYRKLLFTRHSLPRTIHNLVKRDFESCSFFGNGTQYRNRHSKFEFDIKEIHPLILQDDANALFEKVSRLPSIIPFIQEDPFDMNQISAIITSTRPAILMDDLAFIKFLRPIMQARAMACFDLFVRAYLGMCSTAPGSCMLNTDVRIDGILALVARNPDKRFIQQFIRLAIKYLYNKDIGMYEVIKFALNNTLCDVLRDSLDEIRPEKKALILNECTKYDFYERLLKNLNAGYKYKENLNQALEDAIKILNNMPDLDADKIVALQEKVNTDFAQLITCLKGGDNAFAYSGRKG